MFRIFYCNIVYFIFLLFVQVSGKAMWDKLCTQGVVPDEGLKKILELSKFDNVYLMSKFSVNDEANLVKLMRNVIHKSKKVTTVDLENMYGIYDESPQSFEVYGGQKKMLSCIVDACKRILNTAKRPAEVRLVISNMPVL